MYLNMTIWQKGINKVLASILRDLYRKQTEIRTFVRSSPLPLKDFSSIFIEKEKNVFKSTITGVFDDVLVKNRTNWLMNQINITAQVAPKFLLIFERKF